MSKEYQICQKCIMDTTDPEIEFDKDGTCNHCRIFWDPASNWPLKSREKKEERFKLLVDEIKNFKNSDGYNCVIGLSGGVDSSYLAYIVKRAGLNPLAIHVDNGWNTELSIKNIENIVKRLDIDLYTHVIKWEEFRELQLAFLKASVIDLEMLSDNAILAGIYKIAAKRKIKYFIIGTNIATESIMPRTWFYADKCDGLQIKSIYKRFGSGKKIRTYPIFNFYDYVQFKLSRGLQSVSLLDYVNYSKIEAIRVLEEELGWRSYKYKHYESIITRFYQGYILPQKFNVDKRRAHLSSLICSGQMTRQEALKIMEQPLYEHNELEADKVFFLKKLKLSETAFESIMHESIRSHGDFPSYDRIFQRLKSVRNRVRRIFRFPFR
ncbi:MAG: N-acetyl sugar amidotransferase [Candidatus Omnitrophica bacterium]|nr:N-acetyl sugar amidotransferase [Candidatus Omnitrophota bacterium]